MTWEETIQYIRGVPEFDHLIKDSFLNADLKQNVIEYSNSEEFQEINEVLSNTFLNRQITIADVGCGNGITAINFARQGSKVFAIEPDTSKTVGAGAIEILKSHFYLENIEILKNFGENIELDDESVDLYFARQTMHHANDLNAFVEEGVRILKPGGYFFTVRDHVVYNKEDKKRFLETHPLQKFYGGENAYLPEEYVGAMEYAGLSIIRIIKHFDSPINYAPIKQEGLKYLPAKKEEEHWKYFSGKYPLLSKIPGTFLLYKKRAGFSRSKVMDEQTIPGRMYSFIAQKR